MKAIYFLTGFFYNVFEMMFHIIPMSINCGSLSARLKKFRWQMDDWEFGEQLEEEVQRED